MPDKPTPAPKKTRLTRADMEAVLKGGGSVIYRGETLLHVADLPSDAELAEGDPAAVKAAQAMIDQQIADLTRQRAALVPSKDVMEAEKDAPLPGSQVKPLGADQSGQTETGPRDATTLPHHAEIVKEAQAAVKDEPKPETGPPPGGVRNPLANPPAPGNKGK